MNAQNFAFDDLTLERGFHNPPRGLAALINRKPKACLMEAVAWFAGETWTDDPQCVSPVLRVAGRVLNDQLPDDERQQLAAFIPKLMGTNGDGKDHVRKEMGVDWAVRSCAYHWLKLAQMDEQAEQLRQLPTLNRHTALDATVVLKQVRASLPDPVESLYTLLLSPGTDVDCHNVLDKLWSKTWGATWASFSMVEPSIISHTSRGAVEALNEAERLPQNSMVNVNLLGHARKISWTAAWTVALELYEDADPKQVDMLQKQMDSILENADKTLRRSKVALFAKLINAEA